MTYDVPTFNQHEVGIELTEIEFVNRTLAVSEAARAISLLNQPDETKVEAWFAMQVVADQIGPRSNVGVRGISWEFETKRNRGKYRLYGQCHNGPVKTSTGGPMSLEAAILPDALEQPRKLLQKLLDEKGGLRQPDRRSIGTSAALMKAVSSSPEGLEWIKARTSAETTLLRMVNVADRYGRDGVCPRAGLIAHTYLIQFENCAELIREFTTQSAAWAKAQSLRLGDTKKALRPAVKKN